MHKGIRKSSERRKERAVMDGVCSIIEMDCPFAYATCALCHVYNIVEDAKQRAEELEGEEARE